MVVVDLGHHRIGARKHMRPEYRIANHGHGSRNHGLDYLRAIMMILVVIAHVAGSYDPSPSAADLTTAVDIGERFRNPERTEVAARLHQVARASVNPMFFLLAGYSWVFLLRRRSLRSVVWNRTTRILIPLVVGWFIGFPLVRYSFALGREIMLASEGQASLATAFADTPFIPCLPFASDVFYLGHLWFLYYLLLFYATALLLVLCLDRPAGPLRRRLRTLRASILIGNLRWIRLPMLVGLSALATLPDRTPELAISHQLRPDPDTFTAHIVFFLAGWMFALHQEILGGLVRWAGIRFLTGLLLAIFVVVPLGNNHDAAGSAADLWLESRRIQMVLYWLLHGIATWLMILGMLGMAQRWFTRERPVLAYIAEAAFWIYLVHLPFAVFVPVLLNDWSVSADIKMWAASAIVLVICLASHHALVRDRMIGRWLRGRYRREDEPRTTGFSGPRAE